VVVDFRKEAAMPQWLRHPYENATLKCNYVTLSVLVFSCQIQRDDDNPDLLHEGLAVLHQQLAGLGISSRSAG